MTTSIEIVPALTVAVVSLAAAVGLLYRAMTSNLAQIGKKLDECERDRTELFERLIRLEDSR